MLSDEKRYRGLNEKSQGWQFKLPRIDNFYFAAQARWDGRKEKEDGEEARKEGDITYWIKPGVASEGDGKREG